MALGLLGGSLLAALLAATGYSAVGSIGTGTAGTTRDARKNAMRQQGLDAGLSDTDIDYLINQYSNWPDESGWQTFLNPSHWFDDGIDEQGFANDLAEYQALKEQLGDRPADVDYNQLAINANQAIDDENAQVNALYDQMLGRTNNLFQTEMDTNNRAFQDYRNQLATNNAMSTQAIAGSTRYEMDRARRNAIMRGASAAQQLTANVNAQLGLQNRAAQQQLETSNQLASALLQQRQAASQLRGDYVSNLNADASRRADLISGSTERKAGLRNSYYNEAESRNEAETEQWKNRMSGYLGDSPFTDVYNRSQSRGSARKSTYGL